MVNTHRAEMERLTAGPWPSPLLMDAVHALADALADQRIVTRAEVTATVWPLFSCAASQPERDHARRRLIEWVSMLDELGRVDHVQDSYRRCGPAPV